MSDGGISGKETKLRIKEAVANIRQRNDNASYISKLKSLLIKTYGVNPSSINPDGLIAITKRVRVVEGSSELIQ